MSSPSHPQAALIVYIAEYVEQLDVQINAQGEIEHCTGKAIPFEQGATVKDLLGVVSRSKLVKTRIIGDELVFVDTIDAVTDSDKLIHDYSLGIALVVFVRPKGNYNHKEYYFFPIRHFESDRLYLKSIHAFPPPRSAANIREGYARKGHAVYVMILEDPKYIVPLEDEFELAREHVLVTVNIFNDVVPLKNGQGKRV